MSGAERRATSMFDLFRQEVAVHAAALEQQLAGSDPATAAATRAARSIRGAARLAGANAAADLAQAIEEACGQAETRSAALGPPQRSLLQEAVAMVRRIAAAKDEEIAGWRAANATDFDRLLAALRQTPAIEPAPARKPEAAPAPACEPADTSLLGLFLQEVRMHAAALGDGLLAVEREPQSLPLIEPLMRAAHSIKGAARILGIGPLVELAHAMEDSFIAAQSGAFPIGGDFIDASLQAVDFFQALAQTGERDVPHWLTAQSAEFSRLAQQIRDGRNAATAAAPAPAATAVPVAVPAPVAAEPPPPKPAPGPAPDSAAPDVQVAAANLSGLMGLSGEILVETRRLGVLGDALRQVQARQRQLGALLEAVEHAENAGLAGRRRGLFQEARQKAAACAQLIAAQVENFGPAVSRLDDLSERLHVQVLASRMRPFRDGVKGFPRLVRDLARDLGKKVKLEIVGANVEVDRDVLAQLETPLNHMLRNAVDHGLESPEERGAARKPLEGRISLEARHHAGMLAITVADDGRGIDARRVREKVVEKRLLASDVANRLTKTELLSFLFLPGFTTAEKVTHVSGRGVGLDVVRTMIQELRGSVRVTTKVGEGATFHIKLPLSLSVIRVLFVEIGGRLFALPLSRLDRILALPAETIHVLENRQYIKLDGRNISLVSAQQILGTAENPTRRGTVNVVVVSDQSDGFGLVVDRFVETRDLAIRPLDPRLGKVHDIAAAAIMENGEPVLIVDADDLVRSIDNLLSAGRLKKIQPALHEAPRPRKRILVVDDSITVRETQRQVLEHRGYDVKTAVDGADAWHALRAGAFDLVVSDVDMPGMNGLELVKLIKDDPARKKLPVVIVSYKDREEDRRRGLEAGADYYLTKGSFHDDTLIQAVVDLIGEA